MLLAYDPSRIFVSIPPDPLHVVMIDKSLTLLADAQINREATFEELNFLRFCRFNYGLTHMSQSMLYARVFLTQN